MYRLLGFIGCLVVLGNASTGWAQDVPGGMPTPPPVAPAEGAGDLPGPGEGLENAVSGLEYRLGPGDVLAINIWGPQPISHNLPVTLEGKLLIPYVGEVDVNHMLLDDAKARIRRELMLNYRNVEVSISLVGLRRFQIHVLGQVQAPGAYIATAVDRVSVAIRRAGGFVGNASQRQILVENGDSLRTTADLYSFLLTGSRGTNPYLTDGDRVLVPFAKDFVSAQGELNAPGQIQFLEGDRLSDLLLLAGGFSASAFLDTLEVARYATGAADPLRFFVVNGGGIHSARPEEAGLLPRADGVFSPPTPAVPVGPRPVYPNFLIQPYDVLLVRGMPVLRLRRLAEIRGEVQFPGNYAVEEGETRLSDFIAMAGGLTPDASLAEARLVRRADVALEDPEFERLKQIPVADMREDEYGYFKMKSRQVPGEMVVDFEAALLHEGEEQDPLLQRGDLILIPTRKEFVSMLGMVGRPGNVRYRPGLEAKDYIKEVGGFAEHADKGETRVIKARTGEWVRPNDAGDLEPGDVVFIPQKEKFDYWGLFKDTLQIAAQFAAIVLVIDSVSN